MDDDFNRAVEDAGSWLYLQKVVAIGRGEVQGKPCIVVITNGDPEELRNDIPETFRGFPVIIEKAEENNDEDDETS